MKIKTMTASFGKLQQARLELEEGLNILEGPNEGGKSTWAGFIRAMLYGIDTRDRDKKGHLAEKNRYLPWSGSVMEGEMTLEWGGRDITIRRGKKGNNPFGAFSAVYTGTAEPVPGMTGENCGELLAGVSREVFERSAFIGQSGMGVTSTPDLEKRIAALVSSGEEDVSYSQTESCLREWLNRRRVNKNVGLIPKLEAELDQNRKTQSHLERVTTAIARAEGERSSLLRTRQELEGEQYIHQRIAQRELNQRFAKAHMEYEQSVQELEYLQKEYSRFGDLPDKEALKKAQGELQLVKALKEEIRQAENALVEAEDACTQADAAVQDEFFSGLTGGEARNKAQEEQSRYQEKLQQSNSKGKLFLILQILGLVVGGGVMASGALGMVPAQWNLPGYLPYAVGAGAYVVFAGISVVFFAEKNKSKKQAAQILERYRVEEPGKISDLAEDYARHWEKAESCTLECKQIRSALEERKTRRETGIRELLEFVHTFAPDASDLFGCSAALSRALGLEDRIRECTDKMKQKRRHRDDLEAQGGQLMDTLEMLHTPERSPEETMTDLEAVQWELEQVNRALDMARGEQKAMGDPAALSAREEELVGMIARRELEHQALTIAAQALSAANARMQERFSPDLGRLAGQWMNRLTGGKYNTVTLSRDLDASATETDGLLPRKALALSKGTVDQLYLAVRLAVCQLCLPREERAPLVLDDALVAFDDGRMELALDCLRELGQERQVLLFTCQSREGKASAGQPGVKHTVMT